MYKQPDHGADHVHRWFLDPSTPQHCCCDRISYSTYLTKFDGTAVGDLNKDGEKNTILDAEIAAVLALLDEIARSEILDNNNADIGIILFDTEAYYKTPAYAPKGIYAPLQLNPDGSREPNPELVADLKSLQTLLTDEEVLVNNKGFTNFDDALDKAIDFFKDPALTLEGRTNLMVFLSDGKPNVRGDGDVSSCYFHHSPSAIASYPLLCLLTPCPLSH